MILFCSKWSTLISATIALTAWNRKMHTISLFQIDYCQENGKTNCNTISHFRVKNFEKFLCDKKLILDQSTWHTKWTNDNNYIQYMTFEINFFISLVEKGAKFDLVFDWDGVSLELQMFVSTTSAQFHGLRDSKCSEKQEYIQRECNEHKKLHLLHSKIISMEKSKNIYKLFPPLASERKENIEKKWKTKTLR